jgi:anti-sigma factor RsiW
MSTPGSCRFHQDAAAYVIGALSPAERLEFERHLGECDDCTRTIRELAGIPGLLGRVEPDVLEHPVVGGHVPETLLPTLSRQVRGARRRRTLIAAGVAAAAVAVLVPVAVSQVGTEDGSRQDATGTSTGPPTEPSTVEAEPMRPVGDVPLEASVTLESVTWGTRLGLTSTAAAVDGLHAVCAHLGRPSGEGGQLEVGQRHGDADLGRDRGPAR